MKNGWQTKKLGDVATLQRGFDLPTQDRVGGDVPLVTSSGITDTHNKIAVRGPGVATGRSGSIGNVFFIEEDFWPLNTVLYVKDFHGNDPRFVFHLLKKFDLKRFATGSGVPTLNRNFVRDELVNVPPFAEQQRIVGLLDEAFAGIATAKANAEKNLQNARALFESHLQSVFTQRGKGWKRKPLGSLCELISGQHIDAKDYNTEGKGVGYLTGPSDFGFLNPVITKWSEHPKRMAKRGDILVTVKGSGVGKINLLDAEEVAISRQLMAVRATAADMNYLYAFLSTNFDYFQSLSKGAAIPGISREDVLDLMCPMPPPEEQQAIVKLIHAMSEETLRLASLYSRKLAALAGLKKSLLHQAFSGEL